MNTQKIEIPVQLFVWIEQYLATCKSGEVRYAANELENIRNAYSLKIQQEATKHTVSAKDANSTLSE